MATMLVERSGTSGVGLEVQREDIVFPFFFRYIAHDEQLRVTNRYAIQVDPDLCFRAYENIRILLSGRLTVFL